MTKTTNRNGGARALRGLVRRGLATPAQEKLYFEQVVRPAWDARRHAEGEALDLTAHEIVTTKTTKEEGMTEQPYERFLREQNAKAGTTTETTAATDMSEDDMLYERFAAQSGLHDFIGRTPATGATADLSVQDGDQAEISGTTDMSAEDEALYQQFVAESGMAWMLGEDAGGGATDMTDQGQADKQAESMREQAEVDELHESLRQQNGHAAGDGPELSDDEAFDAYKRAIGEGQGR